MDNASFIGTGWSFPPTFQKDDKAVEMTTEMEDINNSLAILLSTSLGERIMQPEYGCELSVLLFESLDATMIAYIQDLISDAILKYEPRIDAEVVAILTNELSEGKLLVSITYRIRATNSRFNYVYPYYIKEGTNLIQ